MDYYVVDYETFYSKEYSLRRMTVPEYILNPLFAVHGAAVKRWPDGPAMWMEPGQLWLFFQRLDPAKTCLIYHNALFDACITAWIFDFVPKLTGDTLGVSRAVLGHKLKSLSLGSVVKHLGLGEKGDTILKVEGMDVASIKQAGLWTQYMLYAINDAEQCANIWDKLVIKDKFPPRELILMDKIIKCAIKPKFQLDQNILHEHLNKVRSDKENLLARVGVTREELMSNDKFAQALITLGVEPPRKISLTTGKETWAFAKTDQAMAELEEHPNPDVQALVAARLGVKTTLEESRTERFIKISQLQWLDGRKRRMPIPLRYGGAHTHRLSGEWKINMQNLPRGGALRRALIAPEGFTVIAPDSSQIEARVNAWLAGEEELLQAFREKRDIYSEFASGVFGYPVNKKMKKERFLGKTSILGLGYGMGWQKFQATIKTQSRLQLGETIELNDAEALDVVSKYRTQYANIAGSWRTAGNGIRVLAGLGGQLQMGPCVFEKERISLPSGLHLHYHKLEEKEDGWFYEYGGKPKRLYGGKIVENIVQALARIVVMDAAAPIEKRFRSELDIDAELALQVHDELVYVVPTEVAERAKQIAEEEMCVPPAWAPNLPLGSECDIGPSYGEAK